MKMAVQVLIAVMFLGACALTVHADADSMRAPDTDYEDVEDICVEMDEGYEAIAEYLDEHEIQDAREDAGRLVNLSARLSAFAPGRRHNEFKEQADLLKEKCLELEQAVVGYNEPGAWDRMSEVRQVCYTCHDLY